MDLHRHLRYLALLIFILATYFSTVLARHHHPVRHRHNRHKRQHAHAAAQTYLPGSFVVDGGTATAESGNWGPWSEPSDCSRSCGGGVAYQTRRCRDVSDTGAELCQGGSKRYFSCNIQDCPESSSDFRAEQCAEFNAMPFEGRYYKWVPYTKAPNKCELNCMPKGERFYFRHKRKVIDGSRCDEEKLDICVDGQCLPVGCDMMLGSSAREDKCRECGGDGSSCNTVRGLLEMDDLQVGYNDILLIPAGATNIQVREIQASNNYLAIRNLTGHYYLNGNWRIDFPRSLKFAGTIFHYERKPHGFYAPESVTALGPTTEPIYIVLLYQETNPGVQYEYSISKGVSQQTDPDSYSWITEEFSECSDTCGGGYQIRNVTCARRKDLTAVAEYLCDPSLEPARNQTCGTDPCPPHWSVGEWEPCSETCGEGGSQIRQVYCEQIMSGGLPSLVEEVQCTDVLGPKPPTAQKCNVGVPCPTWHVGPWKPCNRLCDEGQQKRRVRCFRRVEGKIEVLGDSACSEEKPEEEKSCELRPCEGVDWVVSDWSKCEDKCGLTQETRRVHCANQLGKIYPNEYCHLYRQPELTRECESPRPCDHEWFASQWSECSARCGVGVKTRKVFCGKFEGDTVKKVDDDKCDIRQKYETDSNCTGKEECKGQWYAGPWSSCNKPCDGGIMTRKVLCFIENSTVDSKNCDPSLIHFSSETCNNHPCTKDQIMPMEPTHVVSDDEEEECEDETDGTFITMETTLGLDKAVFGADVEGSGEVSFLETSDFTSEVGSSGVTSEVGSSDVTLVGSSDITSEVGSSDVTLVGSSDITSEVGSSDVTTDISSSDVTSEATSLMSSTDFSSGSTQFGSSSSELSTGSPSSIGDASSSLSTDSSFGTASVSDDIMLSDSTGLSSKGDSTLFTASSSSDDTSSSDASSASGSTDTSVSTSSDGSSTSLSSSSLDALTASSLDVSASTDVESTSQSSIASEASSNTGASSDTSSSDVSSSDSSDVTTEPTDSTSETASSISSISTSSDISADTGSGDEGSGTTIGLDMLTDVRSITGSGMGGAEDDLVEFGILELEQEGSGDVSPDASTTTGTESIGSTISSIFSTESSLGSSTDTTESSVYTSESSVYTSESSLSTSESSLSTSGSSFSTTESISSTSESSFLTTESTVYTTETPTSESSLSTLESSFGTTTETSVDTSSTLSSSSEETSSSTEYTLSSKEDTSTTEHTPTTDSTDITSTEEYTFTDESEETTTELEEDTEETTLSPIEVAITKEQKVKKCRRKKKKPKPEPVKCENTEFGCCPDGTTMSQGPFSKGCPQPTTCEETEFRCCPDGVSPAQGPNKEGCPPSHCEETLFGCCPDGVGIAEGNDNEGCVKLPVHCKDTEFGCCPDGVTAATGANNAGCFECEGSGECETCNATKFGCCPDGIRAATGPDLTGCEDIEGSGEPPVEEEVDCSNSTHGCCPDGRRVATGPNFEGCGVINVENCTASYFGCCPDGVSPALGPRYEGCRMPCEDEQFGCCSDRITPAHGPNQAGCCLTTPYGCCPDNILPAQGPNLEGCGCQYSTYGCCPDNNTVARGPEAEGCGCQYTKHGCCPNRYTPAAGPEFQGCPCYTYQFGCCPDGKNIAKGPFNQGCGCENTEFGCCLDDRTPALSPNKEGCGCEASKHGCCPDGEVEAQGEKFEGCKEVPVVPGEACRQEKDRGPCRDFKVKWFFDMEYGGCSRFWYGGCGGNDNRFTSQDECKAKCVEPLGKDACFLPKIEGPCEGYYPQWYYDSERKQCGQFIYGGCLGTNNRFETREECQDLCVIPDTLDVCEQPKVEGPCRGNFSRWYYDQEMRMCQEFTYGGCQGNRNNFLTESECQHQCLQPGRSRVMDNCALPKDMGPCLGTILRWYYDATETLCKQFMYGGCQGNGNRFKTEEECKHKCHISSHASFRDFCALPRDQGNCTERLPRWFFDASENRCMPFYFSGCEGNTNRFETQEKCEADCPSRVEQDLCLLPAASGECHNYTERWYYDSYHVRCTPFYYGGCGGNQNNFPTMQDCQQRCESGYNTPEPQEEFKTEWCFLPDEHGPCSESVANWFYDSRDGVCKQFLYGGCQGNKNRFETREDCEHKCGHVQGACDLPRVVGPCSGSITQWYYDRNTDTCHEFDYGGCQGNTNRFNDQQQCEEHCRVQIGTTAAALVPDTLIITTSSSVEVPDVAPNDICNTPVDTGPCEEEHAAWYYDSTKSICQAFIYGGCGGNANRFESEEQCERHCGRFIDQDICSLSYETGPCRAHFQKWYYNPSFGGCQEFVYGGCGGNGNRFSTLQECETICLHREEIRPRGNDTTLSHQAVCRLPVDTGPCSGGHFKRWYFDDDRQTCIPFIYSGCAGNLNRFKNFQSCLKFCSVVLQEGYGQPSVTDVRPNEIDVDSGPEKPDEDVCHSAKLQCSLIHCPYGVERFVDSANCERCQCHDPCKDHFCPDETQCAVDLHLNPRTGGTEFRAICRPTHKPGECPRFAVGDENCVQECQSDADCTGDTKCCFNGCVSSCLNPIFAEQTTIEAPQLPPEPHSVPGAESPKFEEIETQADVRAEEGNYVTLHCIARGRPTPTITWRKGAVVIDGSGRYKLLLDGSLQIIGLYRKDSGVYICIADNGIGHPIQKQFQLEVTEPSSRPAEVIGEDKTYVVVTLGAPTVLQCYAVGWPPPTVTWWRGDRMLPLSSEQFEQRRDYSLLIRSVTLRNLGPYTCQAYNGYGRAASWTVTVQAVGPVYSGSPGDSAYNEYLVPPPKKPETPDAPTQRPSYPYRPVRPSPVPRPQPPPPPRSRPPVIEPTSSPEIPPQPAHVLAPEPLPDSELTPRVYIVPVQANVSLTRTVYPIGSDISIPCDVDGYPIPEVVWYKDEQLVEPSERIHITENHRLLIMRANGSDAGTYRCSASNQYGYSSSSISIAVEGVYIHPNCTDNPFFANCRLIVAGQYCTHKYYARFCCKSCTQAGQLPSYGPHLEKSAYFTRIPLK